MNPLSYLLPFGLLANAMLAQAVAIFPDEYSAVAEGPLNSANIPLATGTSRVQCLYEAIDITVPSGQNITKVGFRQDGTLTTLDTGRTVNLEIRMGFSTFTAATMTNNFANNYSTVPVTVFGPANVVLPNLHDPLNPLVDGKFFIALTTPFAYVPAGQNLIVEYRCFGNSGGGSAWNYRLDRADFHSPRTYGPAGCPHAGGGTPLLTIAATAPGLNYSAAITSGPANSVGVLAVSVGQPLVPAYGLAVVFAGINPLCQGQVSPIDVVLLSGVTGTTGAKTWAFAIPNDPAFADYVITSQALFLDLFAPGGVVVSRGGQVLTGADPRSTVVRANGAPTTVTTGTITRNYCPVAFFEHQ